MEDSHEQVNMNLFNSPPHQTPPLYSPSPLWKTTLTLPTVFDNICFHLPFSDIISLRRTNSIFQGQFHSFYRAQWTFGLDRRLLRFVNKPTQFRTQMGKFNTVISGSFALQFFDRVVWEESDLDLFVGGTGGEQDANALAKYLCEAEGYTAIMANPKPHDEDYWGRQGIRMSVKTFLRTRKDGTKSKIQIVLTPVCHVGSIINSFWTTTLINVITWNKAYSIFPSCIDEHKTYSSTLLTPHFDHVLEKYQNRGWQILEEVGPEDTGPARQLVPQNAKYPVRRVGDEMTWKIDIDTTDVEIPDVPDSVIELAQFTIRKIRHSDHDRQREFIFYGFITTEFVSCCLRYTYCFANGYLDGFWMWVGGMLETKTKQEWLRFQGDSTPFPMDSEIENRRYDALHRYRRTTPLDKFPSGWEFCDKNMSIWWEEWERERMMWDEAKALEIEVGKSTLESESGEND